MNKLEISIFNLYDLWGPTTKTDDSLEIKLQSTIIL